MSESPPLNDLCPLPLRKILKQWQEGKSSGAELVEASYYAMLDCLHEYRMWPFPTPPNEVLQYRQLSNDERKEMSTETQGRFQRRFQKFFEQETEIRNRNATSKRRLEDLLNWSKEKHCPDSVVSTIQSELATHFEEPEGSGGRTRGENAP